MYGKWFESVYEGSMAGKGPLILALWGYCCCKADPVEHTVLLNPDILVAKIGKTTTQAIRCAIQFLCKKDSKSQCQEHHGRRLLPVGGFKYFVVTHEHYRGIRNLEDIRAYNREMKRRERMRKGDVKGVNDKFDMSLTPVSVSVSESDASLKGGSGGDVGRFYPSGMMPKKGWVLASVEAVGQKLGWSPGWSKRYFNMRTKAGWIDGCSRAVARSSAALEADMQDWAVEEPTRESRRVKKTVPDPARIFERNVNLIVQEGMRRAPGPDRKEYEESLDTKFTEREARAGRAAIRQAERREGNP